MEDTKPWTLKDWYRFWNGRYFRGRLPDIPVVWSKKYHSGRNRVHCLGSTWFDHDTGRPIKITLNPRFRPHRSIWQSTLLHEMCHVLQWNIPEKQAHGNKFQKEMKRLANAGAFRYLW